MEQSNSENLNSVIEPITPTPETQLPQTPEQPPQTESQSETEKPTSEKRIGEIKDQLAELTPS
ncbi:hypothetical protein COZ14_00245, partial [Candidatus Dojkabacteria bacterium CG_4_10_14_3_um_filter_Dojkabacteria_WS6_41_9]